MYSHFCPQSHGQSFSAGLKVGAAVGFQGTGQFPDQLPKVAGDLGGKQGPMD